MPETIHSLTFCPPGHPTAAKCEALINQKVYVGDDPVGHTCYRERTATFSVGGQTYAVCDECWQFIAGQMTQVRVAQHAPKGAEGEH